MNDQEKKYYSWNEFERDIKFAAAKLAPYRGQIKNVYGIPRGGLVVAVALSHHLNVPLVLTEDLITENTLITDDISDTGQTFIDLMLMDRNITFSLHYNPKSKFMPTVWINKKKAWTVYPWETKETSKYDNR